MIASGKTAHCSDLHETAFEPLSKNALFDSSFALISPGGRFKSDLLIQVMRGLSVRFLGTIKNSLTSPVYFVKVNENGKPSVGGRAVIKL